MSGRETEGSERPRAPRPRHATIGTRAFTLLYEQECGRLRAWIMQQGLDVHHAEDLANEAFLRLWTRCKRELDDPRAYLYRTVGNLVKNHFRDTDVVTRCDDACLPRPARCPTPDEVLAGRELEDLLEATFAHMADGPRDVMRMYLDGEGLAAIAGARHTSNSTVHVQLHRARTALAETLRHPGRGGVGARAR